MLGEDGHGQKHNDGTHQNDAFVNVMDENHDRQLTKSELNYGFEKIADKIRDQIKESHETFVDEAFAKYDNNSDRALSEAELKKIGRKFSKKFIKGDKKDKTELLLLLAGAESPVNLVQRAVVQNYIKDLARKNKKHMKFNKEDFKGKMEHAKEEIERRRKQWKKKIKLRKHKGGKNKGL